MDQLRVLHIPCNVPYIQKIQKAGCIKIVNTFNTPNFSWLCEQAKDSAWFGTFDVCHIHFGFEFEAIETVRAALHILKKSAKPIVFTIHELSSVHGVAQGLYEQYVRMICDESAELITLTDGARHRFESKYGNGFNLSVIPHGMVSNCTSVVKKTSEKKVALIFGSLRKNRATLTSSINLAFAGTDQWCLRLVTRPFTEAQLQDCVLQSVIGLHDKSSLCIETTLPMLDSEVAQTVSDADVLVLPYLDAGHSGQLELAFDCGTPVVCTNVGFLSDQVSFWPSMFHSNITIVNWSDGRNWLYQERLVSAVKQVMSSQHQQRLIHERAEFRTTEHKKIIMAHRLLYQRTMNQT